MEKTKPIKVEEVKEPTDCYVVEEQSINTTEEREKNLTLNAQQEYIFTIVAGIVDATISDLAKKVIEARNELAKATKSLLNGCGFNTDDVDLEDSVRVCMTRVFEEAIEYSTLTNEGSISIANLKDERIIIEMDNRELLENTRAILYMDFEIEFSDFLQLIANALKRFVNNKSFQSRLVHNARFQIASVER